MKAVTQSRYGGPDLLKISEIPLPEPAKGEVRVRVTACAVNLSDWEYLIGSPFYARMVGGLFRPKQPVLGSDIVGVVDKLGAGVSDLNVGQRIMGDFVMTRGGFAEYACVPARHADLMDKIQRGEKLEDAEWETLSKAVEDVARDFADTGEKR